MNKKDLENKMDLKRKNITQLMLKLELLVKRIVFS